MMQPNFNNGGYQSSRISDTKNMGVNGMDATQKVLEEEKEPFSIVVSEPEKFPGLIRAALISSYDLMDLISKMLTPIYSDYAGCIINPLPGGGFDTKLYFRYVEGNQGFTRAFVDADSPSANNLADKVQMLGRVRNKKYAISKEGKQGLSDLFYIAHGQKFDINNCIGEEAANGQSFGQFGNVQPITFAVVAGLDITRIVSKIYGAKLDGDDVAYLVTPVKVIGMNTPGITGPGVSAPIQNWLLSIQAMGRKELIEVQRTVGMCFENGIPMVGRK